LIDRVKDQSQNGPGDLLIHSSHGWNHVSCKATAVGFCKRDSM